VIEDHIRKKFSHEILESSNIKIENHKNLDWSDIASLQDKSERFKDHSTGIRINSAHMSNSFVDYERHNVCNSIDRRDKSYSFSEKSAPGSANSHHVKIRTRHHQQLENIKSIHDINNNHTNQKYIGKSFINWKSIAIDSNDLNKEDKEILGFSPPYVNNERAAFEKETEIK